MEWNEDEAFLAADTLGAKESAIAQTVLKAVQVGLFDKGMFHDYGILTSCNIQNYYFESASRRKEVCYDARFVTKNVNVGNNSINVYNNSVNVSNNSQSRVEESRGEESRVEESITPAHTQPATAEEETTKTKKTPTKKKRTTKKQEEPKQQVAEFVSLSEKELQRLKEKHGEQGTLRLIEILNNYKGSTGKEYKSDYYTICNWVVKRLAAEQQDERKKPAGNFQKPSNAALIDELIGDITNGTVHANADNGTGRTSAASLEAPSIRIQE